MLRGKIENNYKNCGFCETTHYEYDTGYTEYGCTLGDSNPYDTPCVEQVCPLCCRFEVTEDE